VDELKRRLIDVSCSLQQSIFDEAIDQRRGDNMKLVHWPLMGGPLQLVQRGGDWTGRIPHRRLLAVPNVTYTGLPSRSRDWTGRYVSRFSIYF